MVKKFSSLSKPIASQYSPSDGEGSDCEDHSVPEEVSNLISYTANNSCYNAPKSAVRHNSELYEH